jgi:hypothetical protein
MSDDACLIFPLVIIAIVGLMLWAMVNQSRK